MKSKSVKFRILSLLVLAFLITAACIIFLAERQLTRIVDSGQDEIYAEKLAAILADLDRAHRDLQHTGMVQAYEEEAQAEILGELRKEYYASPSPRIYPLILDEKGAVLMHPGGKEDRGELSGPLENMLKDMGGGVRDYTWRGEKKWMVFAHFKQWRWIVVYTTPLDVKYRDVSRFRNRLALIMGSAGVLVTLVLSLLFSRWILNPIARLKNTCEIISGGDLDREIDVSRGDELGSLAASFAHLRDEIKKKITHLNAEIQERRRAETERTRLEAITRITVEAVSAGDYSRRLEVKGEKDLLAVSINRMLANLEEANQDARRKIDYLNKIPAPVHVIDLDFNVQFINDAGADLVRRNAEECVGVKCYELFRTSHCNTENCRARVAMERGGKAKGETVAGLLTGDLPVRYTSAPLEDDAGNIMGVIEYLVDITDEMKVVDLAERISRGDYTAEIGIASEEDRLSVSLNRMIETLNRITAVAEAVAAGDYSGSVEARGERDLLGKAIGRMTENLRKVTEESRREDWIKSGQNQLNERMREEQDTAALTRSLLDFLVERLDVQVGACYLAGKDGRLRLVSSHAYQERSNIYNDFRPGEGMIGQAALEKKSILYNRIPGDHDHMTIHYGIGETAPRAIFILPLVFEDQVQGVVALGATSEFTPAKRELLDRVAENAAIALNSARSRARMKELLERTRSQAEELKHRGEELKASNEELEARTNVLKESEEKLRIQGEELRASNEELETQTVILRESEEKLKIQSEELQAANEELEEKTEILEQQKIEVERKNARIEISRREVEEKARDLALASRYKSEFLANMSHELRTPLNSLLLLAKMLSDNETGNLTEKQVEAARVIDAGGRDLLSLINDILDLSKIEAGKMEVDFREEKIDRIIGRLRDQFNPVAGDKGVAFEVEIAPGIPESLKTDGQRVEQILKNLLSNAFKFTRQGQVRLHIHFPDVGIRFSRVDLDPGAAMAFSVIDTGCGIPEKKQKAIFEAFQQADGTTSRQFGGTGLGLTISRELSRRLGGEIQLRSEPGKGCVFTLFLPGDGSREPTLSPPAPREAPAAPPPLAAPPARAGEAPVAPAPEHLPDDRNDIHPGDKAILVIEDDIRFARILKDFIREKGYKFLAAENGRSGLDLALRRQPFAIILDIQLPDINGLRVLDHLKSRLETRHIPVYIVSVMEAAADSLKKGAIGHQTKPTSPEDIHEVLTKLEERREKKIKEILVIEDDPGARTAVIRLIENNRTNITAAGAGEEALEKISAGKYDLVILDLGLPDMTGFELLEKLQRKKTDESFELPPVIIYTGRELTRDEHMELRTYTESIVVKGAGSPERLLDEVSLFLHSLESSLPDNQKKIIRKLHDPRMVLKGKRILLVDDDLRNSFALASILEKYSLDVVMADNGRLALEKLDQEESIDLVLMDIMMPVMDGYETIRGVRARPRFKKLPIIALTAKAMPEDRARCMDAGANDYLTKPIDEDKLISMLRIWLYES